MLRIFIKEKLFKEEFLRQRHHVSTVEGMLDCEDQSDP